MNGERYIEIYSKHRNRTQFPFPSLFDIPFASTQQIEYGKNAMDPVVNGMIYFYYKRQTPVDMGVLSTGTNDTVAILQSSMSTMLSTIHNYFAGCSIMILTGSTIITRTIIEYDPSLLGVVPNVSFGGASAGMTYIIYALNTPDFFHILLPKITPDYIDLVADDQACNGLYVMDETMSYGSNIVARKINFYDASLRYAYYDKPMPVGWSSNDDYTIRKTLPYQKWILPSATIQQNGFIIITLPNNANAEHGFYNNLYLYFYVDQNVYSVYYIVEYDSFFRKAKCKALSQYVNGPVPSTGDVINILSFSNDNFVPLNYIGTRVSMNQPVCYEVALLRLVLPNVTLRSGSRIAFYPYVYVELKNITSPSSSSQNTIYSNNPESGRALFIVPARDMVLPVNSQFVKLVGRMRQTIKFRPNDTLRFSVYLPDGNLFLPYQEDLPSPYEPNFRLQVHAVFAVRRL